MSEDKGPDLAISVIHELDEYGTDMIKIAGISSAIAAAFRFPATQGRIVAHSLKNQILAIVSDLEARGGFIAEVPGAIQHNQRGKGLPAEKPADGKSAPWVVPVPEQSSE